MSIIDGLFDAFFNLIKINARFNSIDENIDNLIREVRDIDKRLIRIETFVEIGLNQRQLIT